MSGSNDRERNQETRRYWDQAAARFDDQPDHGLRDPNVLRAWTQLLSAALPFQNGNILDLGCGTGSLSLVLAGLGHAVTGIDLSPEMIATAEAKVASAGLQIQFQVMDAAFPRFPQQQFQAAVCRHVLWALPEPQKVLERWANLLVPGGSLLLIEGYWHTNAGMHAEDILQALPECLVLASMQNLSDQPDLWGGAVTDERYAITARRVQAR